MCAHNMTLQRYKKLCTFANIPALFSQIYEIFIERHKNSEPKFAVLGGMWGSEIALVAIIVRAKRDKNPRTKKFPKPTRNCFVLQHVNTYCYTGFYTDFTRCLPEISLLKSCARLQKILDICKFLGNFFKKK